MKRFLPLLLDVWREACRSIELAESVTRIAPQLLRRFPVDLVLVRRLLPGRQQIETAAVGQCGKMAPPIHARDRCTPEQWESILHWCRTGQVLRSMADKMHRDQPALLPAGLQGSILIGPLLSEDTEPLGLLIFNSRNTHGFTAEHEELMRALLEPFAVALRNDRQMHELTTLREAVEADNRSLLSRLGRQDISDAVVGAETGLRSVMERVELVAGSDVPVLILGETGSGKEVVARAIHQRSPRNNGPFLRVNCGAIPPELVDSELFGHERGSFTGAVAMRKGWFERADGGTLFLDEFGELPLAAQVRLLRILQDGTFERVGGQKQMHIDVRIVAATNRDLQQMVADTSFREDLWYRIAVFPIRIPPLRDRREDIAPLAAHFALRAARRLGTPPLIPTPDELNLLIAYDWPGNARELNAVIERAAILGNGRRLEIAKSLGTSPPVHLRESITRRENNPAQTVMDAGNLVDKEPIPTLDEAMRQHIELALLRSRGKIEGYDGAARRLDINPNTLRARMRKLGIKPNAYKRNS